MFKRECFCKTKLKKFVYFENMLCVRESQLILREYELLIKIFVIK